MKKLKIGKDGYPRWTAWEVITARTGRFIIGAIIAFFALLEIFDEVIILALVFLIPHNIGFYLYLALSIPISIIANQIFGNRNLKQYSPEEAIYIHSQEALFRWHSAYGCLIAWGVWCAWFIKESPDTDAALYVYGSAIAAAIAAKIINRVMVKLTGTNQQLLEEIAEGEHWDEFPEDYMEEKAVNKIIKKLKKGSAYSVEDAVKLYERDLGILRYLKIVSVIGGITVAICSILGASSDPDDPEIWDSPDTRLEKAIRRAIRRR